MAILSPVNGSHTLTGNHYLESGEGVIEHTVDGVTVELTVGTLDLPHYLAAGSISVKSGWIAYDATVTTLGASPTLTTTHSGGTLTVTSTSNDVISGSGAAYIRNTVGANTDEYYVRLNNINFPFVAVRTGGSGDVEIDVIGTNSILTSATN